MQRWSYIRNRKTSWSRYNCVEVVPIECSFIFYSFSQLNLISWYSFGEQLKYLDIHLIIQFVCYSVNDYSLNVHWLFIECSLNYLLNVHWMFNNYLLNVHWMFKDYLLNVHWMFADYLSNVHWLFIWMIYSPLINF